jgi:hypothetical protein
MLQEGHGAWAVSGISRAISRIASLALVGDATPCCSHRGIVVIGEIASIAAQIVYMILA